MLNNSFVYRFFILHIALLAGLFYFSLSIENLFVCILLYIIKTLGISVGYHRYFSHRSFQTGRRFQFFLGLLGATSGQRGPLWWAAIHRNHHQYADTEKDIHSPQMLGFWRSHIGWVLRKENLKTNLSGVPDFLKYPEILFLDKYPNLFFAIHVIILYVVGGLEYVYWGAIVATVFQCHTTLMINSVAHIFGKRPFNNMGSDHSGNLWWLAILTLGEGWHNNHHRYPKRLSFSLQWYQIDFGYWFIFLFKKMGLIWTGEQQLADEPIILIEEKI